MKHSVYIPPFGESVQEVVIGRFLVQEGSVVHIDQEIAEIESDKLNQVVYAQITGTISFLVKEGSRVAIGTQIATIVEISKIDTPQSIVEVKNSNSTFDNSKQDTFTAENPKKVLDKPINATIEQQQKTDTAHLVERQKLSLIRRTIADKLVEVSNSTAMLTTFQEVDMSHVIAVRDHHKEHFLKRYKIKLGFMSFFVKAVVSALKEFPLVNSYIEHDELVIRKYLDIGIAVASERGLVVPVVRGCDTLSFYDIEKKIDEYITRANQGALTFDDLSHGSFTITNGGVFGSLFSTPILNPGQSAILGMHKITKRAVVVDDTICIRPMMYLALTYDHRVLDGKDAVSFLAHIVSVLENPDRLLLDI